MGSSSIFLQVFWGSIWGYLQVYGKNSGLDVDFPKSRNEFHLRQDTLAEHTHNLNETHAFTR